MDITLSPPQSDPRGFDAWFAEHEDRLRAAAAAFFPATLRNSPLVDAAVAGTADQLRENPGQPLESLLKAQADDQLVFLWNRVKYMALKLVKAWPEMGRVVEDVPTQVLLVLLKGTTAFDSAKGGFWGWVKGVTKKVAMQLLTRERRTDDYIRCESDTPAVVIDPLPADVPGLSELLAGFRAELDDPTDLQIFDLRFVENRTVEEIEVLTGLKKMTVYKRIQRIKDRFR